MNRARLTAPLLIVAILLPASAEAAKLRFGFGGKRTSEAHSGTGGGGVAVVPGISRSSRPAATPAATEIAPERVPFPPASAAAPAAPTLLLLTSTNGPRTWCRDAMVVGGFCVVN